MSTTKIKLSKQVFADDNYDINAKKITNLAEPTSAQDAATKNYVDSLLGANDAMVFKGTIGTGGTHTIVEFNALTTYNAGWTYRVIEAGTIRGKVCEIGDLVVVITDRAGSGNLDADFTVAQANTDGAVIGPASSTDNTIARFDSTTGKLIQGSLVTIDDNGVTVEKLVYISHGYGVHSFWRPSGNVLQIEKDASLWTSVFEVKP